MEGEGEEFVAAVLDDCRGTLDCDCLICQHLPVEGDTLKIRERIQPTPMDCAIVNLKFLEARFATDAGGHIWQMPEQLKRTYHFMNAMPELFSTERWAILDRP